MLPLLILCFWSLFTAKWYPGPDCYASLFLKETLLSACCCWQQHTHRHTQNNCPLVTCLCFCCCSTAHQVSWPGVASLLTIVLLHSTASWLTDWPTADLKKTANRMNPPLLWSIVSIVVFSGFASLLSWLEGDFNQHSGRKRIIACAFIILQLPNLQGLGYYQYWYYNCTNETHFMFCSKEWIVFK